MLRCSRAAAEGIIPLGRTAFVLLPRRRRFAYTACLFVEEEMKALLVHKLFFLPPSSSLFDTSHNYAGETPYRSQHEVAHCPAKSTLLFFFPVFLMIMQRINVPGISPQMHRTEVLP